MGRGIVVQHNNPGHIPSCWYECSDSPIIALYDAGNATVLEHQSPEQPQIQHQQGFKAKMVQSSQNLVLKTLQ